MQALRHSPAVRSATGAWQRGGLSLLVACVLAACAEDPGYGVVDVTEAFQRSPLAMVSALELNKELAPMRGELKRLGRQLAERRRELEHGNLELEAAQRAEVEAQLASSIEQLAARQRAYQRDLEAARMRQTEVMIGRVESVAAEVARSRGLVLLLREGDGIRTLDGSAPPPEEAGRVDLTEDVIRALLARINPTEIPEADPPR